MDAFIKLLKSPKNYYFFDVNKNTLVNISKECYDYLGENGGIEQCQDEIEKLKMQGFLSNNHVKELKHPLTDKVEEILDSGMEALVLQVTQACNLCCSYCPFANSTDDSKFRSHTSKHMSWETAKRAIDFFAEHSKRMDKVVISFYGGEPLISFPLIKKAVEYTEEVFDGKEIDYSITTNATLLNEEMIRFFIDHAVSVTFSMDGPKEIHDKNRKRIDGSPTYDTVMQRLRDYSSVIPKSLFDQYISVNMVIDPSDDFRDIDEWVNRELNERILVSGDVFEDDDLENKKRTDVEKYNEYFQYRMALELLSYLEIIDGISKSRLADNYVKQFVIKHAEFKAGDEDLPIQGVPAGTCISGRKKIFVSVDGEFFPCEKVNERSAVMKIGSLDEGLDFNNIKAQMNIAQLTPEECINCWAQRYCNICQKYVVDGDHFSAEKKLALCDGARDMLEQMLKISILIKESCTVYKRVTDV